MGAVSMRSHHNLNYCDKRIGGLEGGGGYGRHDWTCPLGILTRR